MCDQEKVLEDVTNIIEDNQYFIDSCFDGRIEMPYVVFDKEATAKRIVEYIAYHCHMQLWD